MVNLPLAFCQLPVGSKICDGLEVMVKVESGVSVPCRPIIIILAFNLVSTAMFVEIVTVMVLLSPGNVVCCAIRLMTKSGEST